MTALSGIRVLDLTIWQQGPMTAAMLADWGADVIKIEGPDSPDPGRSLVRYEASPGGLNAYFETHNRNKRAIVLDLKNTAGRDTFYRLVQDAHVVIQNFRPGVAERLGIDFESLRNLKPDLVYCQASGFGLAGPDAERPALDPLAQARGGVMSVTGEPDSPPTRTFAGFADQVSAFLLAYGVMVALFHRERTGEGQKVDGSLLQSVLGVQAFNIGSYLNSGTYAGSPVPRIPRRLTNPLWNHYRAADSKWLMLSMAEVGRYWKPFRTAIHEASGEFIGPDEMNLAWIIGNATDVLALIARLDEIFASRPSSEWIASLRAHDLLVEIARDYSELAADPQVIENEMLAPFSHPTHGEIRLVAPPVRLSVTPGEIRSPAPEYGQHTEEVLLESGYSWDDIERLRGERAIGA
jgi:crotonobetainyl-CoA:carnitine CoA-transferase CaiB-like acyl-CoA transferase